MKKTAILFLLLSFSVTLAAQTAREDFRRRVCLSGSNYLAYPGPLQRSLTPAPEGYVPCYVSHYARHGSRYLIDPGDYSKPLRDLLRADSAGMLTERGKALLAQVTMMSDESEKRWGELTALGAEQHRGIGDRLYTRFPEVFRDSAPVDAKSTVVIRCILSMENELQSLLRHNPRLSVRHDASEHDMYYMNCNARKVWDMRSNDLTRSAWEAFSRKHTVFDHMLSVVFSDTVWARENINLRALNSRLWSLASILQSSALSRSFSLYDIFSDEEIYNNWLRENAYWYMNYGPSPLNGSSQPYSQINLLRNIISEADTCLSRSLPGATLRFGHEVCVLPLACLLEIDNCGEEIEDLDSLEERGWLNYRIFPMACNIQFIFYRLNERDTDPLVKVLLNENEAVLPLESSLRPYYKWSEVKDFYIKKMDAWEASH